MHILQSDTKSNKPLVDWIQSLICRQCWKNRSRCLIFIRPIFQFYSTSQFGPIFNYGPTLDFGPFLNSFHFNFVYLNFIQFSGRTKSGESRNLGIQRIHTFSWNQVRLGQVRCEISGFQDSQIRRILSLPNFLSILSKFNLVQFLFYIQFCLILQCLM